MKIKKSEINLLLIVAGIAIAALAWVLGASPLLEKTETLEAENITLKTQVDMYQAVNANLSTYQAEMEQMETEITNIGNSFPVNITREDEIMFLSNMEDAYPDDIAVLAIEMGAFMEVYTNQGGAAGEGATLVHMYKQPTNYSFRATYDGFKDMVIHLAENKDKKSIEEMELQVDKDTGNLMGTVTLSQYYMTGLDKEYQAIKIPTVRKGVGDIFHTVDILNGARGSADPEVTEETDETAED